MKPIESRPADGSCVQRLERDAEHSVRIYEAAKAKGLPVQAYFHQGGHGGPPPTKLMNRWFTRYLYGVENGVEKIQNHGSSEKPTPENNQRRMQIILIPSQGCDSSSERPGTQVGQLLTTAVPGQGTQR